MDAHSTPADPLGLTRFVQAQATCYPQALAEIRAGQTQSHWMWFVFPQLAGLGTSAAAHHYGIQSLAEARAYLAHPVLGARLHEIAAAALAVPGRSARDILGWPDELKLRSCATLFAQVAAPGSVFQQLLQRFYGGEADARTLALLAGR